ncbi:MAG: glucose-1-phosphate adenylyltransferase, partial [Armatimonadetes bacterium]|nr:glucose-1-phosphate adenylyltransferase [Armatimonadota bacterium]
DLFDTDWPIRSGISHRPPGKVCVSTEGTMGVVEQSLLAPGAVISGGRVTRSIIGPRVEVHNDSVVEECVVMGGVQIGKGVRLRRCVIEESACIPDGSVVGHDDDKDRIKFKISPEGVRVIPTRAPLP